MFAGLMHDDHIVVTLLRDVIAAAQQDARAGDLEAVAWLKTISPDRRLPTIRVQAERPVKGPPPATLKRRRAFLAALREVRAEGHAGWQALRVAAERSGCSINTPYRWRRADDEFAAEVDRILEGVPSIWGELPPSTDTAPR